MNTFTSQIMKDYNSLSSLYAYFGKKVGNNIFNTYFDEDAVDEIIGNFIGYPRTREEYKHIVSLDKDLMIYKDKTICTRSMSYFFDNIDITNGSVYLIANKEEQLKEIDFPSQKKYQKNENCVDIIFTLNPKINLVITTEKEKNTIHLEAQLDEYTDTTLQTFTDYIDTISKNLHK